MWVVLGPKGQTSAKVERKGQSYAMPMMLLTMGICADRVDDMWTKMYESNQPSKRLSD